MAIGPNSAYHPEIMYPLEQAKRMLISHHRKEQQEDAEKLWIPSALPPILEADEDTNSIGGDLVRSPALQDIHLLLKKA